MKNYILFTNTKEKYHAHSLEFNGFYDLKEHLRDNFNFEEWDIELILEDYKTFLEDNVGELIFDYTIKDFLNDVFHILNCSSGLHVGLFEDLCNGEATILSTFTDTRYSVFVSKDDYCGRSDFLTMALNKLLSKHGVTTSPVGIVAYIEKTENNEEFATVLGYYSSTTSRHVNEFLKQYGFIDKNISKKAYDNTEVLVFKKGVKSLCN